jgi:hypothetical protein
MPKINPTISISEGTDDIYRRSGSSSSGMSPQVSAGDVLSQGDGYLGGDVQQDLDNLSSAVKRAQPPMLGRAPITFQNRLGDQALHDGRPDWGGASFMESASWLTLSKMWADGAEMPLMGAGLVGANLTPLDEIKWVNEGGVFDTINLNHRDMSLQSYFSDSSTQYQHSDFPLIAQSVPRASFQMNPPSEIFPFMPREVYTEGVGDLFNVRAPSASLSVKKDGSASTSLAPLTHLENDPFQIASYLPTLTLTISGKLFPADRGVVALIRFPSDSDATSVGFGGVPAQNALEVLQRCVGAINLGQGAGVNDGLPGGALFTNLDRESFPSRQTGQYDLYEIHTGDYVLGSTRVGANPDVVADNTAGRVRLLTDPLAFNVADNTSDFGIPILFSPYQVTRADFNDPAQVQTLVTNQSFLSYRLPVLADYRPSALPTPPHERDRFFVKNTPNLDQKSDTYNPRFQTAGGYVTFGEVDNYSYQVARYRHVETLLAPASYIAETQDFSEPEYNFGSFALLHFKTETAFERLVRDGVAPQEEDLYSLNLLSYTDVEGNVGVNQGASGSDGLTDTTESYSISPALPIFRPNVNIEKRIQGYPSAIGIEQTSETRELYPNASPSVSIERENSYFSFVSGVIYVHPTSPFSYEGHPSSNGGASQNYYADGSYRHSRLRTLVQIDEKIAQGSDEYSQWDNVDPNPTRPFSSPRPTFQILSSALTAQDNLVANNADWVSNKNEPSFEIEARRQSVWVTLSGLGGSFDKTLAVMPIGDATAPISDLTLRDPLSGLCTFSQSASHTSVMVNKPHRAQENLGVEVVVDDVEQNPSKLLYHSARKISLLELYGTHFQPQGRDPVSGAPISGIQTAFTSNSVYPTYTDAGHLATQENFQEAFLYLDWDNINTADPSYAYTPKASGQSFSIYRYDEEGYKVYQQLTLLPIGGDEANGFALELCSGWDRVNEADVDVVTASLFKYPSDRPVYRMVENSAQRSSAKTHADASFLMVKDLDYYIECYPSIPYKTGDLPAPIDYDETTINTTIASLGGSGYSDLQMMFADTIDADVWNGYLGSSGLYTGLDVGGIADAQCQWLGDNLDPAVAPYNANPTANLGNTSHVRGLKFARWTSLGALLEDFIYDASSTHPHPQPSRDREGYLHYGVVFLEVAPSGEQRLPEYGNFTQDVRGFITIGGMGNDFDENLHAVSTQGLRAPLASLFTLRKDTQERFLDESYRLESTLGTLEYVFNDPSSVARYSNTTDTVVNGSTPSTDRSLIENLQGPGLPHPGAGVNGGYIAFPVRDEATYPASIYTRALALNSLSAMRSTNGHGGAGYLRNSHHVRRINVSNWREAQVLGFPDMTRSLLSGAQYGTPPRGVLVYPYQDFEGETTDSLGYSSTNNLIASNRSYFLPNSGQAGNLDDRQGSSWVDDSVTASNPILRYAQPNYEDLGVVDPNAYPDVGYLRAFDLNFGKAPYLTPQEPYWNQDWIEENQEGDAFKRAHDAQNFGLIEKKEWVRVERSSEGQLRFAPVKLRLVGVDWDMISYLDPSFPLQPRDGLVHEVNGTPYLMRKRVMRVFVKVPGLTSWLDVGVMDNEIGESYRHYRRGVVDAHAGLMEPNGATSDKTNPLSDGAGCCISWVERFLVKEGLVCLDLDLNLGFIPAFNSYGNNSAPNPLYPDANVSVDDYLGFQKEVRVDNNPVDKVGFNIYAGDLAQDSNVTYSATNMEAPLLVKVVLSNPDHPKYEVSPSDPTKLVDLNFSDQYLISDIANGAPTNVSVVDVHPGSGKSYRGHSNPPDDRAPTWARRGLMGIEVLRPDGSNFDHDEVVARPDFTKVDLYGNPTLYYARTSDQLTYESYEKAESALTNKPTYTHNLNTSPIWIESAPRKGEG